MFDDLQAFCAVVQNRGFAKAAKQLHISTPVMTRRITRLEQTLGVRLLQRTTRHLNLTEAGNLFYTQASDILQALETSKKTIKKLTEEVTGTLKIGMPVSISHCHVTNALAGFIKKYPGLKLQIVNGNHLLDLLASGFDMVIHCGNLPDSSFYSKKIGDWKKIICASPAYLKKQGTPKHPQELQSHNCIDHYDNFRQTWRFTEKNKELEIMVKGNINVNSSIDLKNLAVAGMGVVYLPSFTVHPELISGKLISVLEKYQPPKLGMYAVYPSKQYLNKKLLVFLDYIMELLGPKM